MKDRERRVINLSKNDYNTIKKYCDTHSLNLPKWISKLALEEIKSNMIKVDSDFFEHLLNCLCNQKYIRDINADALTCDYKSIQKENQIAIDKAYRDGMDILLKKKGK
jgi:hypothetical protein